jgi:inhibitor of cysteine peptidase
MKRILFLWIAVILLTSCSTSTPTSTLPLPPTAETPNTLPEPTDHTQLLTAKAGETFDLVLPANPSTGYRWDIIPELDANLIEFVAQDYIPEEPVKPGSGGVDVWTFRSLSPGDTTIVLGYYPPDGDADPEETVTFSIRVE